MLQKLAQGMLLFGLGLFACSAPPQPPLGGPAPAIHATDWINHEGPSPSLATLKGKAILLEFWATW